MEMEIDRARSSLHVDRQTGTHRMTPPFVNTFADVHDMSAVSVLSVGVCR